MPTADAYDVLILGAGPAGSSAALFAARSGLRVAVVDRRDACPEAPQIEWLHPDSVQLLSEAGIAVAPVTLGGLHHVTFVEPSAARRIGATIDREIPLVDSARLAASMLDAAREAGATVIAPREITVIDLEESEASIASRDGARLVGRCLIAADGADSIAAPLFGIEPDAASMPSAICCQWTGVRSAKTSARRIKGDRGSADAVGRRARVTSANSANNTDSASNAGAAGSGPPEAGELTLVCVDESWTTFGYAFAAGSTWVVGWMGPASQQDARAEFRRQAGLWREAGFIPNVVEPDADAASVRRVPRGLALDVESHVAKNALLIGDAGGFVSSISHEGLYPAVWSARLAVDVCAEAMEARSPQDVLRTFDARWRTQMPEYLRIPNTDLRFLSPLTFTNARMAEKLARAVLLGVNI